MRPLLLFLGRFAVAAASRVERTKLPRLREHMDGSAPKVLHRLGRARSTKEAQESNRKASVVAGKECLRSLTLRRRALQRGPGSGRVCGPRPAPYVDHGLKRYLLCRSRCT